MSGSWDDPFNNYGRDGGCRPYQEPYSDDRDKQIGPQQALTLVQASDFDEAQVRRGTGIEEVPLQVMRLHPDAQLPVRSTPGAAGLDLYSIETVNLESGQRLLVRTGIAIAMPAGVYARIAPRSGMAVKFGIDVCAGVVDSDFRGEVRVLLANNGSSPQALFSGQRIAQLILERYVHFDAPLQWSESLPDSVRGTDGYGSTGQ